MPMIKVTTHDGETLDIDAEQGMTLMEVLTNKGLPIEAICGGCLSCATCHVYINEAHQDLFPARSDDEQDMLELADHVQENSRLSCQLRIEEVHEGLEVVLIDG